MSDPITSGAGTVAPGQIKFYASIQPPLTAGKYSLQAEQVVKDLKEPGQPPKYSATQLFRVNGPRFAIDPSTIHMVYPPANQEGSYYNVLPNIVFKDFALPWARSIDPEKIDDQKSPPWMGLLTIYDNEMPLPVGQQPQAGQTPQMSIPTTVPVAQVVKPTDSSILPPVLPDVDTSTDEKALVVDINLPFFQAIAPKLSELGLLAHAREVNTDGKVLLGMNQDGCFSVVVGNRVAKKAAVNTIVLVSFEGHQNHLPGATTPIGSQYQKIRLVVLGSWKFHAKDSPGNFRYLMSRLCEQNFGGVKLLQLPKRTTTDQEPTAKQALELGYVPLQNSMRIGEKTTSWYRGPFTPAPTKTDFTYGPYRYSDHAMHYDPEYGMFNLSYAAAWQIGRLLGLSDANYAKRLFDWRRKYFSARQQANDQQYVEGMIAPAFAMNEEPLPVGTGLLVQMRNFMASKVYQMKDDFPKVIPRGQDPRLAAELPGVLSADEIDKIWASGDDPVQALRRKLKGAVE
jgi:hypothetical protein